MDTKNLRLLNFFLESWLFSSHTIDVKIMIWNLFRQKWARAGLFSLPKFQIFILSTIEEALQNYLDYDVALPQSKE